MGKTLELVRKISRDEGQESMARLFQKLLDLDRLDDAKRVTYDTKYRAQLMKELAIQ